MPFTGAHPFAILPLTRLRWLDASCLATGAMAPDLQYFARGHISGGRFGHTLPGIALWCVPITLIIAAIYHRVVAPALVAAAPIAVARRVRLARWPARWSVATVATLVGSAAVGAITHLVWDGFTHDDGFAVHRIPVLSNQFAGVPIFRALQLGCSVLGLVGIAVVVSLRIARTPAIEPPVHERGRVRTIFVACTALGIPLAIAHAVAIGATSSGDMMVAPVTGALAGILVASLIVRARRAT